MAKQRGSIVVASLFASLPVLSSCKFFSRASTKTEDSNFEFVSMGEFTSGQASTIYSTISEIWKKHSSDTNFDRQGLRPLLFLIDARLPQLSHLEADIPKNLRLFNFGAKGFILAETEVTTLEDGSSNSMSSLPERVIWLRGMLESEARNSPIEVDSNRNTIAGTGIFDIIHPDAKKLFLDTDPFPEPQCRSIGFHTDPEAYSIQSREKAECILYRSSLDTRLSESEIRSSLVCLHPTKHLLLDTHLDRTQLLIPIRNSDSVLALETAYSPSRVTRIDLDTLRMKEFARPPQDQAGLVTTTTTRLPETPIGAYRCNGNTFVYIDADTYLARRDFSPLEEMTWQVTSETAEGVKITAHSWSETAARFPQLSYLPSPNCTFSEEPDFRCALQTMPRAMKLFELIIDEKMAEFAPDPVVRHDIMLVTFFALARLQNGLPNWLLEEETSILMAVFAEGTVRLESQGVAATPGYSERVKTYLSTSEDPVAPQDEAEKQSFQSKMPQVDAALWKKLLSLKRKPQ